MPGVSLVTRCVKADTLEAGKGIMGWSFLLLTEFRDCLRGMLARTPASVQDLIEIERELAKVQAELADNL